VAGAEQKAVGVEPREAAGGDFAPMSGGAAGQGDHPEIRVRPDGDPRAVRMLAGWAMAGAKSVAIALRGCHWDRASASTRLLTGLVEGAAGMALLANARPYRIAGR